MYNELLGFDIRLCAEDYMEERWDQESKTTFLLKPEINWILSVDTWVWPSVFSLADNKLEKLTGYVPKYLPFQGMIKVKPSDFRHQNTSLWPNLEEMKACYFKCIKQGNKLPKNAIPIAVELVTKEPCMFYEYWRAVLDPALPLDSLPKEWQFLGYDIADQYMVSGLSNCGYDKNEKILIQKTWSSRLNEYGLLETLEDAVQFKELSDQRVPEHVPFYVYGLFRDPSVL